MLRLFTGLLLASLWAFAQTAATPPPGKLTTLYGFSVNGATGARPDGGLVLDIDGNSYGTTTLGGCCGTLFRVTSGGDLTTIYSFTGGVSGGQTPRGIMTRDNDGNLYGTTDGSTGLNPTAYKITPGGVFTSFGNVPGSRPNGLVFARDGNLYGTTSNGGPGQNGVFFRITTAGVLTSLHVFNGRDNTDVGPTTLIQGNDDAFYGANRGSILRITADGTVGVVYKPQPVGNGPTTVWDGLNAPASGLVLAGDGNFYGAADDGIFRVTPDGNFKRILRYTDVGLTGSSNTSVIHDNRTALILGGDGNLYGSNGDDANCNNCGSVYQVTTGGAYTLIYKFAGGGSEGGVPSMLTSGPDGLYGTTGTLGPGKPLGGGTVFKIEYAGSGTGGTVTGTPPDGNTAPGPIEALDPNVVPDPDTPGDTTPNLRGLLLGTTTWIQSSYQLFADYSQRAKGLVADGVTPIILRCTVPAADGAAGNLVTFTIADEIGRGATTDQVGTLGCIYSDSCAKAGGTSYTVQPQQLDGSNQYEAFVRLTAPLDFVRPASDDASVKERLITVTARLLPTAGVAQRQNDAVIILARPPVVLLHGIWSSKDTWGSTCDLFSTNGDCLQTDNRFVVWAEDYQETNADYFVDNLGLDPFKGKNHPREGIHTALGMLRSKGFAATQADLVGHSMGGLLARLYVGEYIRSPIQEVPAFDLQVHYHRDDNLQAGDMHKLITLDSPHFGSEMTGELLDSNGIITNLGVAVNAVACVICGAVSDLTPGSPPLSNMPTAKVPSHAIFGVGGNQALADAKLAADSAVAGGIFSGELSPFGLAFYGLTEFADSELNCLFGGLRHDTIVSATSQIGGMPVSATTAFDAQPSLANPSWWAIHNTVTKDSRISTRVIELLNAPAQSDLFSQFPASSGTARVGTACQAQ